MKLIKRLIIIGIKKISVYREYIVFSIIKNMIYIFIQYMLWKHILMYQQNENYLPVIMLYFILNQFLNVLYPNISMSMSDEIKEGTIINRLCKPVSIEKQYFFEGIGSSMMKISTISIFNIVLLIYFSLNFSFISLFLLFILIVLGYILHFVLELFFGCLAFFTQSIWGIDSFKEAMNFIFSGSIFPIFLYPEWIQKIINILPFSYAIGKISEFYIDHVSFYSIAAVQLINIIIIYVLYKLIVNIGIKRIIINGG